MMAKMPKETRRDYSRILQFLAYVITYNSDTFLIDLPSINQFFVFTILRGGMKQRDETLVSEG